MTPLLDVRRLNIEFPGNRTARSATASESVPLRAVRDLSFSIAPGEVLGLVGESGSGKSLTSLALMRLLPDTARTSGEIFLQNGAASPRDIFTLPENEMRHLRGATMAMIFQEPMTALNPVIRVGDQIAEAVRAHHKVSRAEAWQRAVDGMNEVAIPDAARRARDYPHQLSGGMRQRIMIAMAIVNRPRLLIADELTTALDVTIQAQILELLAELRDRHKLAVLFISHDLGVVSHVADRVAVMYAGEIVEMGPVAEIFSSATHAYTRGLIRAIPTLKTDRSAPLATVEKAAGRTASVALREIAPGHWARVAP